MSSVSLQNRRTQGKTAEGIVEHRLRTQGWDILATNYTIRGGELDIIATNNDYILCVEVKMVGVINDIMAYVTDKKMTLVKRTFNTYFWKYPTMKQQRIDVVFVKDGQIRQVFENVTGT